MMMVMMMKVSPWWTSDRSPLEGRLTITEGVIFTDDLRNSSSLGFKALAFDIQLLVTTLPTRYAQASTGLCFFCGLSVVTRRITNPNPLTLSLAVVGFQGNTEIVFWVSQGESAPALRDTLSKTHNLKHLIPIAVLLSQTLASRSTIPGIKYQLG